MSPAVGTTSRGTRRFEVPIYGTPAGFAARFSRDLWHEAEGWIRERITAQVWAALLTLLTFVSLMAGYLAERAGASDQAVNLCYALAYLAGGTPGLRAGFESLLKGRVDIDLLMVLAALGAWVVGSPFEGAMLLFLFSLSNVLQYFALDRTRAAIRALTELRPDQALVRRGGQTLLVAVEDLLVGDLVVVRPGDRIPVDGEVISGSSAVDQSSLTGESLPCDVSTGSQVLSGSINQWGGLEVRVTRLAQDSTIARMIRLVEEARGRKAQTQQSIERFESGYAWLVISGTLMAILLPILLFGESFDAAFYRGMTIMVAASPCALVISIPAAILSAIGNGARRGILFKGGIHLEQAARVRVVAFDKTGTLTKGEPHVTGVRVFPSPVMEFAGVEDDVLALAAAVEAHSEHPLGQAILEEARARALAIPAASDFHAFAGLGAAAQVNGRLVLLGNIRHFIDHGFESIGGDPAYSEMEQTGATPVLVGLVDGDGGRHLIGVIGLADRVRPDVPQVVAELHALGIEKVVMLTGDNASVARSVALQSSIDVYHANLLPEDKVRLVGELRENYGPVAMVGDGVNDAPALAASDLGIAMGGAGSDVVLETADVALLSDDLGRIPYLLALSRRTQNTLRLNLVFAFSMIALMLVAIFAVDLPLPLAVLGHEGGTVLVSLNGLLLLLFTYRGCKDARRRRSWAR
jgi:Cd2+/Zn2+-exporting ATPase